MPYYVFDKKTPATALTMTGSTKTFELDETADYTAIILRFAFTADTLQIDALRDCLIDWITSITIIGDDDKYVVNNTGRELAALAFRRLKRMLEAYIDTLNDSVNTFELPILFGRYIGDPEYYLSKGQFSKLELNITNGDSSTGDFFDAGTVEIHELQLKGNPPTPKGCFRSKQIKSWTPGSATEAITEELPDKNPIECIMVSAIPTYTARITALTAEMTTLIDKIKLTYRGGDVVVFDDDWEVIARRNAKDLGMPITRGHITWGAAADKVDSHLGYVVAAKGNATTSAAAAATDSVVTIGAVQKLVVSCTVAADLASWWEAQGLAYMDAVFFTFDVPPDLSNLYQPTENKKGEIKVTAGSTAGVLELSVVEVVTAF